MSDPFDELGFVPAQDAAPPQPSALEHLAGMARGAGQTLYDGAVGLSQGLSGGGADELMGAMPGTSIAEQQQIRSGARARSPVAYDLGNAAGSTVPMLLSGGGSALEQIAMGALQGGATSALGTDGSLEERAGQGIKGLGVGAGLSAAATGVGAVLKKGSQVADQLGNTARAAAFSTPGKLTTLARGNGDELTGQELAQQAERMGLTNKILPQNASTYAQKAGAAREIAGKQHGAALDAATAEGVFGDSGAVAHGLEGIRTLAQGDRSSLGAPRERVATDLIDRLGPDQPMSPIELWALKKQYERAGGFVPDEIKRLPEGQGPLINQEAAGFARRELGNTMEMASPETREAFDTSRRDYAYLAAIENLAKERAIHNATHGMGMTHSLGLIGGGGLVAGPAGAMGAYASGQAARAYGQDAAANLMNGAEGALGFGSDMLSGAGSAVGQVAGQANAEQAKNERERLAGAGKGHEIENVARQALQSDPSVLGQYAQQFEEAQQDEDPMRMTALIASLSEDPKFRMTVLPRLQQMSNPQGGY